GSVFYTLDASDPIGGNSTTVPSGGTIVAGNYWLRAVGTKPGCEPSAVVSVRFQVTGSLGMSIAAGFSHNMGLPSDGVLFTWGDNTGGSLGDGTTDDRLLPTQLRLTGVTAISAHGSTSVAQRMDNTLWTWGPNYSGELGDGTPAGWQYYRLTPKQMLT